MKTMTVLAAGVFTAFLAAGCARGGSDQAEPPKATMKASGETTYQTTPMGGVAQGDVQPAEDCKNVLTCYSALARDLCLNNDPACTSSFEVTAPVDNEEVCENMLDRAKELAKPFVQNKPNYEYPEACD